MKSIYKSLFTLLLLLNIGEETLLTAHSKPLAEAQSIESPTKTTQTQAEGSDIGTSSFKGEALLESNTLSQQLKLIELKALFARIKEDIKQAPYCLSDKDYTPIMQLLQKKMDTLASQIKTLESSLPEQPESIDIEDLLQKSFTVITASFATIIVLCLIIQSSREEGRYHFPSITRLMKNIRG